MRTNEALTKIADLAHLAANACDNPPPAKNGARDGFRMIEEVARAALASAPPAAEPVPSNAQLDRIFAKYAGVNEFETPYLCCYAEQFRTIARDLLRSAPQPAEPAQPAAQAGAGKCWSCKTPVTAQQRTDADGDCPHCGAELDQELWPAQPTEQPSQDANPPR